MFKVINVTAVPFQFARLQSNATKNIFQRTAEITQIQSSNIGVPILTPIQNINISSQRKTKTSTSSNTLNDRMIKKKNRILRNRVSAKVSREKWRLNIDLIEQQLICLKEEKERLLLENQELRLQQQRLEEFKINLQRGFETNEEEKSVSEDTLEHAEGMGSSTHLQPLLDDTQRDSPQFPVATVPEIPSIEDIQDFEQLFKYIEASNFYEESDVFVCPLSQDLTKDTAVHDTTAVARTVFQEIEVSCSEELPNSTSDHFSEQDAQSSSEELNELFNAIPSYPEMWTFDNLYEDINDSINYWS